MNAIGPETFHGQHRGTGTGLQYTCNRIAGIIVGHILLGLLLKLDDNGNRFLGSYHRVVRESDDGSSCVYCGSYDHLWRVACVVIAV